MENITVEQLRQKCKNLNIELTKSDGTRKLKRDLINRLEQNLNKLNFGGKKK